MEDNNEKLNNKGNKNNDKLYSSELTEERIFYFYDEKNFEINIAEKYVNLEKNHTNKCNNTWYCKYPIKQEEIFVKINNHN